MWLRKPRAAVGVWACVAELQAEQLEVIGVELAVWPRGNEEADDLVVVMRCSKCWC